MDTPLGPERANLGPERAGLAPKGLIEAGKAPTCVSTARIETVGGRLRFPPLRSILHGHGPVPGHGQGFVCRRWIALILSSSSGVMVTSSELISVFS
jgi:hypothetical protein